MGVAVNAKVVCMIGDCNRSGGSHSSRDMSGCRWSALRQAAQWMQEWVQEWVQKWVPEWGL